MAVAYKDRPSDTPLVERVWYTLAERDGADIVAADAGWDMIVTHIDGQVQLSVWGPMTRARTVSHAAGSEAIGIRFRLGAFMPDLPVYGLPNAGETLPEAARRCFWLDGDRWEYPTYENVETFVDRLVRADLLLRDDTVEGTLQGDPVYLSQRSIQRRFQRVTGLTRRDIHAIERARQAASLLERGASILDTVYETGYADQQSMTKALHRLLGQTPGQIARSRPPG